MNKYKTAVLLLVLAVVIFIGGTEFVKSSNREIVIEGIVSGQNDPESIKRLWQNNRSMFQFLNTRANEIPEKAQELLNNMSCRTLEDTLNEVLGKYMDAIDAGDESGIKTYGKFFDAARDEFQSRCLKRAEPEEEYYLE